MEIHLCMGCMREQKKEGACPYCGFNAAEYHPSLHHLPPYTILDGKYLVGRVIGEGGFGITYLGWDLNLEMKIAIKEYFPIGFAVRENQRSNTVFSANTSRSEFFKTGLNNFVDEAKRIAKFYKLSGIVSVRNYFQENGTAYIVMEFIEGETLRKILERNGNQLDPQYVFTMMRPVMRALETIHKAGIIHRDISPENLMVDSEGNVILIDFGAARNFTSEDGESLSILLKPGYAPIEQYHRHGQGPWTDVYGLCATMYRAITGMVPANSLERIEHDSLAWPSELGVQISPWQEEVLKKGLAASRKNRYQSMAELEEALFASRNAADLSEVQIGDEEFVHLNKEDNIEAGVPETEMEENIAAIEYVGQGQSEIDTKDTLEDISIRIWRVWYLIKADVKAHPARVWAALSVTIAYVVVSFLEFLA